ncbi:hypothetical protein, partial [Actinoplanes utahensis]|uniref:hypothetical protein n=1 Tax=Actinoplanes utahensis TaxID=1869 RepID=UPI00194F94A4
MRNAVTDRAGTVSAARPPRMRTGTPRTSAPAALVTNWRDRRAGPDDLKRRPVEGDARVVRTGADVHHRDVVTTGCHCRLDSYGWSS